MDANERTYLASLARRHPVMVSRSLVAANLAWNERLRWCVGVGIGWCETVFIFWRRAGKRQRERQTLEMRKRAAFMRFSLFALDKKRSTRRVLSLAVLFALFRDRRFKVALCFSVSLFLHPSQSDQVHIAEDVQ